jgi:ABC-type multidrug transport system permease subunit
MQAMQMSTFVLLPFVFLSGYVFPIDGMPQIFRLLSRLIPARYFIEVLRGIILRGAGVRELWEPIAWLLLFTVAIIAPPWPDSRRPRASPESSDPHLVHHEPEASLGRK